MKNKKEKFDAIAKIFRAVNNDEDETFEIFGKKISGFVEVTSKELKLIDELSKCEIKKTYKFSDKEEYTVTTHPFYEGIGRNDDDNVNYIHFINDDEWHEVQEFIEKMIRYEQ